MQTEAAGADLNDGQVAGFCLVKPLRQVGRKRQFQAGLKLDDDARNTSVLAGGNRTRPGLEVGFHAGLGLFDLCISDRHASSFRCGTAWPVRR